MVRLGEHERTRKSWGNAPMINCGGKYFRFVFVVHVATVSNLLNREDFNFLKYQFFREERKTS